MALLVFGACLFQFFAANANATEYRSPSTFASASLLVSDHPPVTVRKDRASQPSLPLRLTDLVADAMTNNPAIAEKQAHAAALERRILQVSTLPDPMFITGVRNMGLLPSIGRDPGSSLNLGLSQQIPFPGKLQLRKDIAHFAVERANAEIAKARAEVIGKLKEAYFELAEVYRASEISSEVRELWYQVKQIAATRYGVGQVDQTEVLKVQLAIVSLSDELITLESRKKTLEGILNSLLGRSPLAKIGYPASLSLVVPDLNATELANRLNDHSPSLLLARAEIRQSQAMTDLASQEYLPDLTLMGNLMSRGGLAGGWEVTVSTNLPVFFTRRQDQQLSESQLMVKRAKFSEHAMNQELLTVLRERLAIVQSSSAQEELYRLTLLPSARQVIQAALASYAVGRIAFSALFEALVALKNYELQYTKILAAGNKALAGIDSLTGAAY